MTDISCRTCGGRAPLCQLCHDQHVMWFSSLVALAGERWAREAWRRAQPAARRRTWPRYDDHLEMAARARERVQEWSKGDELLTDRFARSCAARAADEWSRLR